MKSTPFRLLPLLAIALASCNVASPSADSSLLLAADDPIQTYEQYKAAKSAAYDQLHDKLPREHTECRAVPIIRLLAQLPSAASRHYAEQLAAALRPYGVPGLDHLPTGGRATISYSELAKVETLSEQLLMGWEQKPSPPGFRKLPYDAALDLDVAIATNCPSDWPPFSSTGLSAGASNDFETIDESDDPDKYLKMHHARGQIARALYIRFTDTSRTMNYTWVEMSEQAAEGFLAMFVYLDHPSGHDVRDFSDALDLQIPRALQLQLPAEKREQFERGQGDRKLFQQDPWNLLDHNCLLAAQSEPMLRQFFQSLNTNELTAASNFLATTDVSMPQKLATLAHDFQSSHAEFQFSMPNTDGFGSVLVHVKTKQSNGRSQLQTIKLNIQQTPSGFRITILPTSLFQ